jgi:hypothetical protein
MVDILCLSSSGRLSISPKMFLSIFSIKTQKIIEIKKKTVTEVLGFCLFVFFDTMVLKGLRFMPTTFVFLEKKEKSRKKACVRLNPKTLQFQWVGLIPNNRFDPTE